MKPDPITEIATEDRLAQLITKLGEMKQRTLAAAAPLKARYAELHSELKFIERAIRDLDEDWRPPR
jgi:hypothetical protein